MRRIRIGAVALCVAIAAAEAPPSPGSDADERFRFLAAAAGQEEPLIRIGLDTASSVLVSSRKRFRILDPQTGEPVWRKSFHKEVALVAEGEHAGGAGTVYRIQVAAFSAEEAAEAERKRLADRFQVPAVVRYVPDRGTWRVRLGQAKHRDRLTGLMTRLRSAGLTGLWIAEEPAKEIRGVNLRIVDTETYESHATGLERLAVTPSPAGRVRVEGKPYRGVVEVRISPYGTVRAVNWIDLEQYLRGVVPAELGPEVWPQLEALKAQAVAARTYAWKHLGQFEDEGFDLCATPRCQVYGGRAAEHPLTDHAVEETQGEVLTWEGQPISAMYTATCGGHTENAEEIFPEEKAPYLRGVPCRAESEALERDRITMGGRKVDAVLSETGVNITRDTALLDVSGVLGGSAPDGPLDPGVLVSWTASLSRLAGTRPPGGPARSTSTLGEASLALLRAVGWEERARVLLGTEDLPAILAGTDVDSLPEEQRRALAYLVMEGMIRPFPDGSYGAGRTPSASRFIPALARIGETYRAFGLREGTVAAAGDGILKIFHGKREKRLEIGADPVLFDHAGSLAVPVGELHLWPGDRVRYRKDSGGAIDFLERVPPLKGVSDDRTAAVYSWKVRKTRKELETTINRRVDVGPLKDLQVVRRGVSGRVVELRVTGEKASTVVRGFDIRNLLDLRELLMVMEIQRDRSGRFSAAVFSGKGWGHGIGLCQVGAYGMAVRGKGYRAILSHYYTGAELDRLGR
jgi:stage II sporulation protein D